MRLKLNAPLIIFDVETTGHHRKVDRIVQIGLVKYYPDGQKKEWMSYVNPTIPIPPESTEVHKITDEKVKDAPKFADLATKLAAGFKGCDYGGLSIDFDIGFFEEEFKRLTPQKIMVGRRIDAMAIYRKYFPRSLTDAVREYLRKEMVGAHDALVDARETAEVLVAQLERHPELSSSVQDLHHEFNEVPQNGHVDPEGKLYWRYNEATINFGSHAGEKLREVPRGWLKWVLENDFSDNFKEIVRAALSGQYPVRSV